jgi:glutaminyl-tRNA synthetase
VRLYDHLFTKADPDEEKETDFTEHLNPRSLEVLSPCYAEPSLGGTTPGSMYQFLRLGYFCVDSGDSGKDALVFNRTVTLKDTWARIEKAQAEKRR